MSSGTVFKIDCLNNISYYDEESILSVKLSLFKYFESQEESFLEIQYLLNKINPSWRLDSVQSSYTISNDVVRKHPELITTQDDCQKLIEGFNKLDYDMEFFAFEHYIDDLAKILIKVFNLLEKDFKVQSYNEMLELLANYSESKENIKIVPLIPISITVSNRRSDELRNRSKSPISQTPKANKASKVFPKALKTL